MSEVLKFPGGKTVSQADLEANGFSYVCHFCGGEAFHIEIPAIEGNPVYFCADPDCAAPNVADPGSFQPNEPDSGEQPLEG